MSYAKFAINNSKCKSLFNRDETTHLYRFKFPSEDSFSPNDNKNILNYI